MDLTPTPQHIDHLIDLALEWSVTFLPRFLAAIAILVLGAVLARWISRGVSKVTQRATHVDPTLRPVLVSIVHYAVLILIFVVALSEIGVQTGSLLAVLGAAGLAIGLALQGTLSNIAAGLMLLWLRPFRIGDFVEVKDISGTVREIGLFVCHLETFDGVFLFVPNSAIWNNPLRNHTRNAGRLVSLDVTMPAAADIDEAREVLLAMARRDERILKVPEPRVFVEGLTAAGLVLNLRIWATHAKIRELQRGIIEQVKREFETVTIETLRPQQIVRIVPPDSDPSRLLSGSQPIVD